MNENTTKLLEQLAAKLGTTTEYLWGILVKQAAIDSWISLLQIALIFLIGFGIYGLHRRFVAKDAYNDEGPVALIVVLTVIWVILLVFAIAYLDTIITGFMNPEYWALERIMRYVK